MARNDIRTDGRPIPLTHHSARGKVQRNSGNFTRGSQLLTHELLMWFAGAKLPFVVWFFVFLAAWFVIMSLKLDEHGFQLVCMKLYAMLWDWVGFDPTKRVNVRLPSGELHRTIMAVVPLMPEVQRAWSIAMRGLLGALLFSVFLTIPLSIWFVDLSRRRGKTILQERHERGAMLVDREVLVAEVSQHNAAAFEMDVRKCFPGQSPKQVLALPFTARKRAGIHHPYTRDQRQDAVCAGISGKHEGESEQSIQRKQDSDYAQQQGQGTTEHNPTPVPPQQRRTPGISTPRGEGGGKRHCGHMISPSSTAEADTGALIRHFRAGDHHAQR